MPVPNRTPKSTATNPTASSTPAPGGGASQVWVNTDSKVYHCHNDRYYGKTKQGEYMSEADALARAITHRTARAARSNRLFRRALIASTFDPSAA